MGGRAYSEHGAHEDRFDGGNGSVRIPLTVISNNHRYFVPTSSPSAHEISYHS